MKTIVASLAILGFTSLAALAAEPAMMGGASPGKSACDAKCLKMWPAFYADKSAKSEGDFTIVKASDGKNMWAYKDMPLYFYHDDKKPGDMTGDGKGGVWHIVK